jgi:hypothetical protein
MKFKSDRHIVQLLDAPYEDEPNTQQLFPWFRLIMFLIYFTGLCRRVVFDLLLDSDDPSELPNLFQYDVEYDLYYINN